MDSQRTTGTNIRLGEPKNVLVLACAPALTTSVLGVGFTSVVTTHCTAWLHWLSTLTMWL